MSYDPENMSVLAYANGFTLWHYKSSDSLTTIKNSNYFADAKDIFRSGDTVLINSSESNGGGNIIASMTNSTNATISAMS